jgi:hypothetical protein
MLWREFAALVLVGDAREVHAAAVGSGWLQPAELSCGTLRATSCDATGLARQRPACQNPLLRTVQVPAASCVLPVRQV